MATKPKIPTINKISMLINQTLSEIPQIGYSKSFYENNVDSSLDYLISTYPTRTATYEKLDNFNAELPSTYKTAEELSYFNDTIDTLFNNKDIPLYRLFYPTEACYRTSSSDDSASPNTLFPGTTWVLKNSSSGNYQWQRTS